TVEICRPLNRVGSVAMRSISAAARTARGAQSGKLSAAERSALNQMLMVKSAPTSKGRSMYMTSPLIHRSYNFLDSKTKKNTQYRGICTAPPTPCIHPSSGIGKGISNFSTLVDNFESDDHALDLFLLPI